MVSFFRVGDLGRQVHWLDSVLLLHHKSQHLALRCQFGGIGICSTCYRLSRSLVANCQRSGWISFLILVESARLAFCNMSSLSQSNSLVNSTSAFDFNSRNSLYRSRLCQRAKVIGIHASIKNHRSLLIAMSLVVGESILEIVSRSLNPTHTVISTHHQLTVNAAPPIDVTNSP